MIKHKQTTKLSTTSLSSLYSPPPSPSSLPPPRCDRTIWPHVVVLAPFPGLSWRYIWRHTLCQALHAKTPQEEINHTNYQTPQFQSYQITWPCEHLHPNWIPICVNFVCGLSLSVFMRRVSSVFVFICV